MAQADNGHNFESLRLNSSSEYKDIEHALPDKLLRVGSDASDENAMPSRPLYSSFGASQDTIRPTATPPVDIPVPHDTPDVPKGEYYMNEFLRDRTPSVSFNNEIKLDSGHRQSMHDPLEKPAKPRDRGRSMFQAMAEAQKQSRAHSESEQSHYDRLTGRHLPKYSSSPPREQAKIGEGRFPLLQTTVDAMAREGRPLLQKAMSMLSASALSPVEQTITPTGDESGATSPAVLSPDTSIIGQAFSYEEPKSFRRTASQRWRDGETTGSPQDFFARAGSLRNKSMRDITRRTSRRDTSNSVARSSPKSAASSYLRAFSMSNSTDGDDGDRRPIACDAEGQTIGDDYVLGKQIGYGGFSIIREVKQLQEGKQRTLAVKIVRRQIDGKGEAENEQAQAEFEHEVELWRFLNHSNILPLEAVYKLDEATFCFIPLNVGGTLFDLVRANRKGVPHNLAKSYSYQLASALRYLHLDARVVHRDVKLENCLIEPSPTGDGPGLLRVCDFGMAEWLANDSVSFSGPPSPDFNSMDRPPRKPYGPADTSTSAFAGGSLEYAAPELLRLSERLKGTIPPERAIVSPAVDMWAYGVCVYSMIVGSRPFQNSFQPRVVMAILAGDWDRNILTEKGGDDVAELVKGCLEMEEKDRWDIGRCVDCDWLEDVAQGWSEEGSASGRESAWRL
jgi:serine/threonine protein kinase